jgi:hypothetical protein
VRMADKGVTETGLGDTAQPSPAPLERRTAAGQNRDRGETKTGSPAALVGAGRGGAGA